jgi:hypothetical protein
VGLPPEYERLRRQLLKESGFADLERAGGEYMALSNRGTVTQERLAEATAEMLPEYYDRAREFLATLSGNDHAIWERYAEGDTFDEISRATGIERSRCYRTVLRLRDLCFFQRRRRPGPPNKPDGYGNDCYLLQVRLNRVQAEALFELAETLKIEKKDVARVAILELRRRHSRNGGA